METENGKQCHLCGHDADVTQAMDRDKMYDGLDVNCPDCGVYRISRVFIQLNNPECDQAKEYAKFLRERPLEEKRKIYWVTTDGIKRHEK